MFETLECFIEDGPDRETIYRLKKENTSATTLTHAFQLSPNKTPEGNSLAISAINTIDYADKLHPDPDRLFITGQILVRSASRRTKGTNIITPGESRFEATYNTLTRTGTATVTLGIKPSNKKP